MTIIIITLETFTLLKPTIAELLPLNIQFFLIRFVNNINSIQTYTMPVHIHYLENPCSNLINRDQIWCIVSMILLDLKLVTRLRTGLSHVTELRFIQSSHHVPAVLKWNQQSIFSSNVTTALTFYKAF